jgi:hypothetical protein
MNRFGKFGYSVQKAKVAKSTGVIHNISSDADGNLNFNNKRLKNVKEAGDWNDVVTFAQLQKEKHKILNTQQAAIKQLIAQNESLKASLTFPYLRGSYNGLIMKPNSPFEEEDANRYCISSVLNFNNDPFNLFTNIETNFGQYANLVDLSIPNKIKFSKPCIMKLTIGILKLELLENIEYKIEALRETAIVNEIKPLYIYKYSEHRTRPFVNSGAYLFAQNDCVQIVSKLLYKKDQGQIDSIIQLWLELKLSEIAI